MRKRRTATPSDTALWELIGPQWRFTSQHLGTGVFSRANYWHCSFRDALLLSYKWMDVIPEGLACKPQKCVVWFSFENMQLLFFLVRPPDKTLWLYVIVRNHTLHSVCRGSKAVLELWVCSETGLCLLCSPHPADTPVNSIKTPRTITGL